MAEFYVKVETGCDDFNVDCSGSIIKVFLTSEPERGRANTELVDEVSRILDVNVGIISGHKSRRKKLVADMKKQKIEALLCNF